MVYKTQDFSSATPWGYVDHNECFGIHGDDPHMGHISVICA